MSDAAVHGRALVDPALLGRHRGPIGAGALVPIIDLVAGARAVPEAGGDWLATSDLWLFGRALVDADHGGPLTITTRLLRVGRRSVTVMVEVMAAETTVATGSIGFSRISRQASAHDPVGSDRSGRWRRLGSGPLLDQPLEAACGFRVVDAAGGVVEVERAPFVNNSIGTLQGGVVALLADVAAAAIVGPGAVTVDLQFRFLAQTGDGPARTAARILTDSADGTLVEVEVVDAADGRLVGLAACRVIVP